MLSSCGGGEFLELVGASLRLGLAFTLVAGLSLALALVVGFSFALTLAGLGLGDRFVEAELLDPFRQRRKRSL